MALKRQFLDFQSQPGHAAPLSPWSEIIKTLQAWRAASLQLPWWCSPTAPSWKRGRGGGRGWPSLCSACGATAAWVPGSSLTSGHLWTCVLRLVPPTWLLRSSLTCGTRCKLSPLLELSGDRCKPQPIVCVLAVNITGFGIPSSGGGGGGWIPV